MLHIHPTDAASRFCRDSILILEDNADHLYLIQKMVKECMPGINAIGVSNVTDALAFLASDKQEAGRRFLNMVLLDLYMPAREEGLLALEKLKDYFLDRNQPTMPVVVFSYSESSEDIAACYAQGANAYTVKSDNYQDWAAYFDKLRGFWLETVSLPPVAWHFKRPGGTFHPSVFFLLNFFNKKYPTAPSNKKGHRLTNAMMKACK